MAIYQFKRLMEVEKENQRLHKAVSDLTFDKLILKEIISEKCGTPSRRREAVMYVRQTLC